MTASFSGVGTRVAVAYQSEVSFSTFVFLFTRTGTEFRFEELNMLSFRLIEHAFGKVHFSYGPRVLHS